MIIPKTWHGVTVVVPKKTLKYKLKGGLSLLRIKPKTGSLLLRCGKNARVLLMNIY